MDARTKPDLELAKKTLPRPLFKVLQYLIPRVPSDCVLVGGTALSGFYIAHRRSDDLDLFVKDEISFKATQLAVTSLKGQAVQFHSQSVSSFYFHANCSLENHFFTIDVVLDPGLFSVGEFFPLGENMQIASLQTLLRMKAAALVSRCSEKDLADMRRLLEICPQVAIEELIRFGRSIESGVSAESMLASVGGTQLREEACDFSLSAKENKKVIFRELERFQKQLVKSLQTFLVGQPAPPLGELMAHARRVLK